LLAAMSHRRPSSGLIQRGFGRIFVHPAHSKEAAMPRGDKSSYTDKQKRQAQHVEASEKKRGVSTKSAERIAWATVNKQDGGGKKKH
jgi:hypothetical protein